ncbi:hypothetical protein BpHYR1_037356 [Brachionus plicatilis]|uniref:Uncharacterized protein n=1 Tax=Brachionus plicatilis TaxID=10195 RepID=A0A3M7PG56_BRAPC|nr:hypothetical protein BpHYR1_037356 [Brachionus plicatilis]
MGAPNGMAESYALKDSGIRTKLCDVGQPFTLNHRCIGYLEKTNAYREKNKDKYTTNNSFKKALTIKLMFYHILRETKKKFLASLGIMHIVIIEYKIIFFKSYLTFFKIIDFFTLTTSPLNAA